LSLFVFYNKPRFFARLRTPLPLARALIFIPGLALFFRSPKAFFPIAIDLHNAVLPFASLIVEPAAWVAESQMCSASSSWPPALPPLSPYPTVRNVPLLTTATESPLLQFIPCMHLFFCCGFCLIFVFPGAIKK